MKNYPDVTMIRCPVRGIVFYADDFGERAFRTPKEAQSATDAYRAYRELSEKELTLSCANRVECTDTTITVYTNGEVVSAEVYPDRHSVRQAIGKLPQFETHKFIWL